MTVALLLSFSQFDPSAGLVVLPSLIENTPLLIFAALNFCIALACLAIWQAARDYNVLLTMGLFFAAVTAAQIDEYLGGIVYLGIYTIFTSALFVETAGAAMRVQHRRWTRFLWPLYIFVGIALITNLSVWHLSDWPFLISETSLLVLFVQGFRHGNGRDRIVVGIFFAYFLFRTTLSPLLQHISRLPRNLVMAGWNWQVTGFAMFFLGAATLGIVLRDLIRDRREKLRLSMEIEAARAVQQVLIPEEIPTVAGFAIQSIYKPYSEVGGDFFQIIPTANAGVLIAIGDVSGKGVPAAMTVSLLVGTIRTLAHYMQSPAGILAAMNQRMLGRGNGGFTTCLVLRADRDGTLTIANAGHIAPFIRGEEISVESGLPLGLAAESNYTDSDFSLRCGDQLTLVTDGVVEARNFAGELYGFERTAAIAGESADAIAQQAREFGQNDDITVLTLSRTAVAEEVAGELGESSLSPSPA